MPEVTMVLFTFLYSKSESVHLGEKTILQFVIKNILVFAFRDTKIFRIGGWVAIFNKSPVQITLRLKVTYLWNKIPILRLEKKINSWCPGGVIHLWYTVYFYRPLKTQCPPKSNTHIFSQVLFRCELPSLWVWVCFLLSIMAPTT